MNLNTRFKGAILYLFRHIFTIFFNKYIYQRQLVYISKTFIESLKKNLSSNVTNTQFLSFQFSYFFFQRCFQVANIGRMQ